MVPARYSGKAQSTPTAAHPASQPPRIIPDMDIKQRQRRWALGATVACEGEYCVDPRSNVPWLSQETLAEFLAADGNEFGEEGERPKIAALHSSSALAVNVFDYWRNRDKSALGSALGLGPRRIESLSFERKFPTGVGPRSPNIDAVFGLEGGGLLAIECKFTEWMGSAGRKPLRDAYLPADKRHWAAVGLRGAQQAAETYGAGPGFNRLDVPQLLQAHARACHPEGRSGLAPHAALASM